MNDVHCRVMPVDRGEWRSTATSLRDSGWTFFDTMTGIDNESAGVELVLHLWSPTSRDRVELRTSCPAAEPRVDSLSEVFGGAAWHEREIGEMFGVDFDGHPGLVPLLLPTGFTGHPLRKEFVLAAREDKAWPGLKDPVSPPGRLGP